MARVERIRFAWPYRWLFLLAAFCCAPLPSYATDVVFLKLVDQTVPSIAGLLRADQMGAFRDEAIALNIVGDGSENDLRKDISRVEVYLLPADKFLSMRAKGIKLTSFAVNAADSAVRLYFRRGSGVHALSDLTGRSIGCRCTTSETIVLELLLEKNGISKSGLTEVPHSGPDQLLTGGVDVLIASVGFDAPPEQEAKLNMQASASALSAAQIDSLDPRSFGVHVPGTFFATSEETLRKDPSVIVRFLRAVIKGWENVYEDTNASAKLLSERAPQLTRASLQSTLDLQRDYILPGGQRFGETSRSKLGELYSFMLRRRLLPAAIDLLGAIDERPLLDAYRRPRE
ncbi:ABC transporter substrate-binding protein [Bradyrhizobium manausense]|uniref:ABC transporter substrate-binding protein n=1 Tax=Bradyrhizobium manausense TaxID=989370 RepID=UPI001BA66D6F|nr:ABC transporter substrate-binding protein [Bradyrhizobium manausense]MBR1092295.1 ABC transporter substrate-binding protein [Bradyrhizobium manausense]